MSAKAGIDEFFSIIIQSVKRSPCLKAILIHFSMNYIGDEVPSSLLILAIFFFPYFVCTWRDRTQWCCGVTVLKLMQLNHVRGFYSSVAEFEQFYFTLVYKGICYCILHPTIHCF